MAATSWAPQDIDRQAWGVRSPSKKAARKRAKVRRRERQLQDLDSHLQASDFEKLLTTYLEDQPGNALGSGMPLGSSLRMDGESHAAAWKRVLRSDPCVYCGELTSTTIDHIHPRSQRRIGTERWVNWAGACPRCNHAKRDTPLLLFMLKSITSGTYTRAKPYRQPPES
jgi:5-methylcytosine-specific restriction endonuclease McrA